MARTRARARRRAAHLSIAIAIALATCAVQFLDPGNATRIGACYTIAVVVASMSVGLRWGLGVVVLSLALDVVADPQGIAGADLLARWPRVFVLVVVAIVTARLTGRIRDALRRSRFSEERFRRSFEDSHIGMAIVATTGEHAGAITEVNPALADLLRTPADELIGKKTIASFVPAEETPALVREMERLHSGEISVLHRDLEIVVPGGQRRCVSLTASMVRDDDGKPIYRISQIEDIDARRRAEDKLRWLADHDALTELPNRRNFARELDAELATRSRGAVVICDLDGFKQVNDSLGHPAGDRVLALVAQLLRTGVRSGDIVARIGGDEFGVLLRRVDPESVEPLVEKLVAQVDAGLELERPADAPRVTLSAGSASFDAADGAEPGELLGRADRAMYLVKQRHHRGRDEGREGSETAAAS